MITFSYSGCLLMRKSHFFCSINEMTKSLFCPCFVWRRISTVCCCCVNFSVCWFFCVTPAAHYTLHRPLNTASCCFFFCLSLFHCLLCRTLCGTLHWILISLCTISLGVTSLVIMCQYWQDCMASLESETEKNIILRLVFGKHTFSLLHLLVE